MSGWWRLHYVLSGGDRSFFCVLQRMQCVWKPEWQCLNYSRHSMRRCCQLAIYVIYGIGADPIFSHCSFYQAKRHGIRVIHNINMPCDCCQHSRCTCVCFPICSTGWIDVRLLMTHKVKLRIVLSTPTEDMGFVWLTAVTQSFPDAQYVMDHGEDYTATIRCSITTSVAADGTGILQQMHMFPVLVNMCTLCDLSTLPHFISLMCTACTPCRMKVHGQWFTLSYGLALLEKCCLSNLETSTTAHCT